MNKSGVKGNTQANQVGRELTREKKRGEHTVAMSDSTQDSIVKSSPWAGSASRQVAEPSWIGGMGKDRITSDHRTDCLIGENNPTLDHHLDRMDEHGGMKSNTETGKYEQGNVLTTDKNFKMNPNSSVK